MVHDPEQLQRRRRIPIEVLDTVAHDLFGVGERSRSPRYTPLTGIFRAPEENDPREPQEEGAFSSPLRESEGYSGSEPGVLHEGGPRTYNRRRYGTFHIIG